MQVLSAADRSFAVAELHTRLAERFASLRSARNGRPVFCLEHGLDPQAREQLIVIVGSEVRRRGISGWWRDNYLPLLVAATETGYVYLGTGTDFWPKFTSAIGADIATYEHGALSQLFEAGHREHGIRKPVATPWTRAFRHIAWPIANSVAPMEIHRPLANALREVYRNATSDIEEAALVKALQAVARQGWSSRLLEWLADGDLAAAIALRLLRLPDAVSRLSTDTLDRVLTDLMADHEARQDVERAVALRSRTTPAGQQRPPPIGRCSLRLSQQPSGGLALSITAPPIPHDLRERLRRALALRRIKLFLWGRIGPVDHDHFLSGYPVPFELAALPVATEPFLPDVQEAAADSSVLMRLAETGPDISSPIFFRVTAGNDVCTQYLGATLPNAVYRILTAHRLEGQVDGVRSLGRLSGLNCIEADTGTPAARSWLEQKGLRVSGRLGVDMLGGLPLGEGPRGPVFRAGAPIILHPRLGKTGVWPVTVRSATREILATLDEDNPFAAVQAESGDHLLLIEASGQTEEIYFQVADADSPGEVLEVVSEPPEPTVDDLVRDNVVFRLRSPLPIEEVTVRATIFVGGTEAVNAAETLPRLPTVVGPASRLYREIVSGLRWESVPRDASIELAIDIGGVWHSRWRLGWELKECFWEEVNGKFAPSNDSGELPVWAILASEPLSRALPRPEPAPEDGYMLLLPEMEGQVLTDAGMCIGPRTSLLGMPRPDIPARLLRQPESRDGAVGLTPCLEAYCSWASAAAAHPLADYRRRTVVERLEAAAVQQLCGPAWVAVEERIDPLPGDRWAAFVAVCMERSLACGEGLPVLHPAAHPLLMAKLESTMRARLPDLWSVDVGDRDSGELGEELDFAVIDAYERLRSALLAEGRPAIEEADAFKEPERWVSAVREATSRYELTSMLRFILPSNRAASLREPDYGTLSVGDIVSLLDEVHVDTSGRPRWLSRDDIRLSFALWTDSRALMRTPGWKQSMEKLLADRQTARAIRYAALRFRASRAFTARIRDASV